MTRAQLEPNLFVEFEISTWSPKSQAGSSRITKFICIYRLNQKIQNPNHLLARLVKKKYTELIDNRYQTQPKYITNPNELDQVVRVGWDRYYGFSLPPQTQSIVIPSRITGMGLSLKVIRQNCHS